jgi:predicted outer membrane repeat protein
LHRFFAPMAHLNLSDWASGSSDLEDSNDADMMVSPDLNITRKPSRDPPDDPGGQLRSSSKSSSPEQNPPIDIIAVEEEGGTKRNLSIDETPDAAKSTTSSEKRRSSGSKYMGRHLVNLVKQFNTEAEKILHDQNNASSDPPDLPSDDQAEQASRPVTEDATNLIRSFNEQAEKILYAPDSPEEKTQEDPPDYEDEEPHYSDEEEPHVSEEEVEDASSPDNNDETAEDFSDKEVDEDGSDLNVEDSSYDQDVGEEDGVDSQASEETDGREDRADEDVEQGVARRSIPEVGYDDSSHHSGSTSSQHSYTNQPAVSSQEDPDGGKAVMSGDFAKSLESAEASEESSQQEESFATGSEDFTQEEAPMTNVSRSVAFEPVPEGSDESASSGDDDVSTLSSDAKRTAARQRKRNCILLVLLIIVVLAALGVLLYFLLRDDDDSAENSADGATEPPTFPGPGFGDDCVFLASVDELEEAIIQSKGEMINICYAPLFFSREIVLDPSDFGGKVAVNLNCTGTCIFDGEDNARFFRLGSAEFPLRKPIDFDLQFTNIIFQNGNGGDGTTRSSGGGALQLTGVGTATARFEGCRFDRNRATYSSGGAIYMDNIHTSPDDTETSNLELIDCVFTENTANRGGAISASDVDISLERTRLEFNIGFGGFEQGGAIYLDNKYPDEVAVTCIGDENEFDGNEASDIWGPSVNCDIVEDPTPPLPGDECVKLANNTVAALEELILSANGNQINLCNTALSFDREIVLQPNEEGVVDLSLSCPGGCVFVGNGDTRFFRVATDNSEPTFLFFVKFERIIFQNGGASNLENGGAVELIGLGNSVARFNECTFRGNRAIETNGGAIFMQTSLTNQTVVDEETTTTSVEVSTPGLLELKSCGFLSNQAYNGGAVAGVDITMLVEGTYFRENRASGNFQGGAIFLGFDEYEVDDVMVTCIGDDNEFTDNVVNDIVGPSTGCGVADIPVI